MTSLCELFLYGFIVFIGIFEVGHLAGVFTECSLTDCGRIIVGLITSAGIFAVMGLLLRHRTIVALRKDSCKVNKSCMPCAIFFLLLVMQIYYICTTPMLQTSGDIVLETVNSFLATDGIYEVSPLTGRAFGGTPFRYEILCLPTVYALLCKWFGLTPEMMVGNIIPAAVVCLSYMAYYLLGGVLFGRDHAGREKRWCFLVIVAMVFFLCEQSAYMEGYGILHAGHSGTTIRNSVLIPLTLWAGLERKWLSACLCVLAEACIVWTFWGMGMCMIVLAGIVLVEIVFGKKWVCKIFPALKSKGEIG